MHSTEVFYKYLRNSVNVPRFPLFQKRMMTLVLLPRESQALSNMQMCSEAGPLAPW